MAQSLTMPTRNVTTTTFHMAFEGAQTILCDRHSADSITRQMLTKGWWFFVRHTEGEYEITFSEHIDLERFKRRSPNIRFRIDA